MISPSDFIRGSGPLRQVSGERFDTVIITDPEPVRDRTPPPPAGLRYRGHLGRNHGHHRAN